MFSPACELWELKKVLFSMGDGCYIPTGVIKKEPNLQIGYVCPRSTHIFPLFLREVEPVRLNIFPSWFVVFPSNLSQNMLLMKLEFLY